MRNLLKRVVAFMMIVVMLVPTLAGCNSGKKEKETPTGTTTEHVTRAQWITWLAQSFGMENYLDGNAYYTDVTSENEIFPYVQSSYEWGVLSTDTKEFKPNEKATLGFVLSTAVLAGEFDYSQYEGESDNEKIINCAIALNLCNDVTYEQDVLSQPMDEVAAALILNTTLTAYGEKPVEEYEEITFAEAVVDCRLDEVTITDAESGDCVVNSNTAATLQVGSVFIEPATPEYPAGRAVKVAAITQNEDGTFSIETVEPEFEEVFEEIQISQVAQATPDMFVPAEGVTVVSSSGASNTASILPQVSTSQLAYIKKDANVQQMAKYEYSGSDTITLNVDLKNGTVKPSVDHEVEKSLFENSLKTTLGEKISFGATIGEEEDSGKSISAFEILSNNENKEQLSKFITDNAYQKLYNSVSPTKDLENCLSDQAKYAEKYKNGEITYDELKQNYNKAQEQYLKGSSAKFNYNPTLKYDAGWNLTGTVQLKFQTTAKADIKFPLNVKEISVDVTSSVTTSLTLEGKLEASVSLGSLYIPLGATGADIQIEVVAKVEANGQITIEVGETRVTTLKYEDGKMKKTSQTSGAHKSIKAQAELYAGVGPQATLRFLGLKIIDVTVTVGAKYQFSVELKEGYEITHGADGRLEQVVFYLDPNVESKLSYPICKIEFGSGDTLAGRIKFSDSYEIALTNDVKAEDENGDELDIKFELFTIKYIYLEEPQTEEVTTEVATSPDTQSLEVDTFQVQVGIGGTKTVGIESLPEKYKKTDLIWESENTAIATVDQDGKVTGVAEGTTNITVSTPDGTKKTVNVIVREAL